MKKIRLYSEVVYIISQLSLSLSVAMMVAADFGISMIVAPAYILSVRFDIFSFGQWNYIIQGVLFVAFCIVMKRFKLTYLVSFLTAVVYGELLDMWCEYIPLFNAEITPPGSMALWLRLVMFVVGELLTCFAVTLFFKTYIHPQVCDVFVKGVAEKFGFKQAKVKWIYDICCLIVSFVLTIWLIKDFVGIKWGTVVIALTNGVIIGWFLKIYDKFVETVPLFPKFEKLFKF